MKTCEFCGAAIEAMSTKCSGCGAAQSLPTAAQITASVRATPEEAVRQAVDDTKPKGNWGCLIALVILFWPAAVFYYLMRRWK